MASKFGGYDYSFVDQKLDRYTCETICTKILKDPHITKCCGQHLCESCLDNWFSKHCKESCPHCRAEGKEFVHFLDKKLKREIDSLRIHCTNKEEGCQWIGELESLKDHLESANGCGFVEVECPNCEDFFRRKDLDYHLKHECCFRPYQCEHCGHKDTYLAITGVSNLYFPLTIHYDTCPKFPLECPNECGRKNIKRKDMEDHCRQCPEELVACTYGCKPNRDPPTYQKWYTVVGMKAPIHYTKLKRKDLAKHLNDNCELRPCTCIHCELEDTYKVITEHYNKCPEFPLKCHNMCSTNTIKRKDMEDHHSQCPNEPVQCPFEEAGCKEKLVRRELKQHMSANQQQHLLMVMGAYKEMKRENEEIKTGYGKMERELHQVKKELTQTKAELKQTKDDHQKLKATLRNQGTISDEEEDEPEEEYCEDDDSAEPVALIELS